MGFLDFLFSKKKEGAPESSSEQASPTLKNETVDWHTNDAHLLLLGRFLYAQKAKDVVPSHWESVLGEPPQRAVDRFVSEGWLVPAPLSSKLDRAFTSVEIKKMLKERNLSASGRKEQGLERLIKEDPEGMKAKVDHLDLMQCSPEAMAIAERFVNDRKKEREAAEAKSLELLRLRDLRSALLTVAEFEARQVFPRGIGIDWTKPDVSGDTELLIAIFQSRPKILSGLREDEWEPLCAGAAMMHLWGTNSASNWLPKDLVGITRLDHNTTARMVLFHAQHQRNMAGYIGERGLRIEILASSDPCPQCKKIAGKRYSVNKVPELPYEKCTHEMGCRCEAVPVM